LPLEARTLHRLLGTIPGNPQFRHHADNPLPLDVVVVDEASMIDLPLMCKLVEAVADGARLVLLGDRDQLPSIEAGDVLAAITDAAGDSDAQPPTVARWLAPLVGDLPHSRQATGPLAGHRVHLRRGYRQDAALQLTPLADALREGDADCALELLRGGQLSGVHYHEGRHDPLAGATREPLLAGWRAIATATDPLQALQDAARVRLLTALRDGPQGAGVLNARIEEALAGAAHARYFHGRLLLVHENDYRQHLFNGDLGVCLRDGRGDIAAWFPDGKGGVRSLHPSTLPAHGGAFAMTVHKAQGSEAGAVWLLLPRQDARPLSRELLYTAVTRARSELHICADEAEAAPHSAGAVPPKETDDERHQEGPQHRRRHRRGCRRDHWRGGRFCRWPGRHGGRCDRRRRGRRQGGRRRCRSDQPHRLRQALRVDVSQRAVLLVRTYVDRLPAGLQIGLRHLRPVSRPALRRRRAAARARLEC